MKFSPPLIEGTIITRYKRFLADIRLKDGRIITAHCPNSGSMKTCWAPDWPVMISDSRNPKRKLQYTLEMVHNGKCWIGINTLTPNRIVREAIEEKKIPQLSVYTEIRSEVPYGQNSRIDLLLSEKGVECYVEIKNVTLVEEDGWYTFPDSVTERGRKHLVEMRQLVAEGKRAVMFFVIQRDDGCGFRPARHIDPDYADALKTAQENGVEILVWRAEVNPDQIYLTESIAWRI